MFTKQALYNPYLCCCYVHFKKLCGFDLCNRPQEHSKGDVVLLCNLQLSSLIIITLYVLCNCVLLFFTSMIGYIIFYWYWFYVLDVLNKC